MKQRTAADTATVLARAMTNIARAIGTDAITVTTAGIVTISINANSEPQLEALARTFGAKIETVRLDAGADGRPVWWRRGRKRWELHIEIANNWRDVVIEISGPHYKGLPPEVNRDAIAAEAEHAEALVQS